MSFSKKEHLPSERSRPRTRSSDSYGVRSPLLDRSEDQDSIELSSMKNDPFNRSLSIKRNLKDDKIYCFEAFAHFLKGNIGSGYTLLFYFKMYMMDNYWHFLGACIILNFHNKAWSIPYSNPTTPRISKYPVCHIAGRFGSWAPLTSFHMWNVSILHASYPQMCW